MPRLQFCAAFALLGFGPLGCQSSCGDSTEPVLWADGIVTGTEGARVYETTAIEDRWLHFPSYRSFRFPHRFGTKNVTPVAYVSLDEDQPVAKENSSASNELAMASGNVVVIREWTDDELVLENGSCENAYYLYLRIEETQDP